MKRNKIAMAVLFLMFAASLFLPVIVLVLRSDWRSREYFPVPVKTLSARVLIEDGRWRASNVKLIRLDLSYSFSYKDKDYVGKLFSCERFGGDEIMPRIYTEALNSELSGLARNLASKKRLLVWVPEGAPDNACLSRNGDIQYLD